jgi:photosystem II PsbZ protein
MSLIFQLVLCALIILSTVLVVAVPVAFGSPSDWSKNKGFILSGAGLWFLLVVVTGILSFVI